MMVMVMVMVMIVMEAIAYVAFDMMGVFDKHNYNTYKGILKDRNIEKRMVEIN